MFLVPFLIILCSYTYIFIVSYKHRQFVRGQGRDITGMPTIKHHMKGAHTLAIVVALCLLSIIALLVVTSLPQITRGPRQSNVQTAQDRLRRGHVFECHMQPSYLWVEK